MDKPLLENKKKFVLALGGSTIAPKKGIDTGFLKKFHFFIEKKIGDGFKFVIIVGGGGICRTYQKAASEITDVTNNDKDWIGIHATRLNAHLVRTLFRDKANPIVFDARFRLKEFGKYPLIIGAGWRPGWSTDFVACQIATDLKISQVVVLGKPEYIYTADPQIDKSAQPIKNINWNDYLKLIPSSWSPGFSSPIDPVAARLSQKQNLKVIITKGDDLKNLNLILQSQKFKGTTVSD